MAFPILKSALYKYSNMYVCIMNLIPRDLVEIITDCTSGRTHFIHINMLRFVINKMMFNITDKYLDRFYLFIFMQNRIIYLLYAPTLPI